MTNLNPVLLRHVFGDPVVALASLETHLSWCRTVKRKRCDRTVLVLDGAGSRQTAAPSCRGSAGSSGTNCVGDGDCFGCNEGSVC